MPGAGCEAGFMLTALWPTLLLLSAFFLGSLAVTARTQARVALQARLDACAVRLAVRREHLLARLVHTNAALEATVVAINAARAAMLVPGAGAAAAETAQAMVQANQAIARGQDLAVSLGALAETRLMRCAPDAFSRETAACWPSPSLATALARRPTLFPDVAGRLRHRRGPGRAPARITCRGPRGLATELAVIGDGELIRGGFRDEYAQ